MGEKQPRCKNCKRIYKGLLSWLCWPPSQRIKTVNPGQFACKKFVYKDK